MSGNFLTVMALTSVILLVAVCHTFALVETEPNNTCETADGPISSFEELSGFTDTGGDSDYWFLAPGSYGSVKFALSDTPSYSLLLLWSECIGEDIFPEDFCLDDDSFDSTLQADKRYWLEVVNIDSDSPQQYTITITNNGDASLPVTLSMLTAVASPTGTVNLRWRTETETNNLGFNIYRSNLRDGKYVKVNAKLIQGAGTDATPHDYSFTDKDVKFGQTYYYYIENVAFTGKKGKSPILKITVGQESEVNIIDKPNITILPKIKTVVIPAEFALLQNYPNPFNPDTWLPFKLAQNVPVTISIYDTKGQLIRTIALGNWDAGIYVTKSKAGYWDGKDSFGEKVASGVYYYTLQAGEFKATRKMVILK